MLLGAKEADAEKDMTNVTYCLPLLFFIPYDAILPQKPGFEAGDPSGRGLHDPGGQEKLFNALQSTHFKKL